MVTATDIWEAVKKDDPGVTLDHVRYRLGSLRRAGKLEGFKQAGNVYLYKRTALAAYRAAEKGVKS